MLVPLARQVAALLVGVIATTLLATLAVWELRAPRAEPVERVDDRQRHRDLADLADRSEERRGVTRRSDRTLAARPERA
jgi:hypothetical protein